MPFAKSKTYLKLKMAVYHNFNLLIIFVFFVIFSTGVFMLIMPKYKLISKERNKNDKVLVDTKEKMATYLDKLEEYNINYAMINPVNIEKINLMIPPKSYTEEFFPQLEQLTQSVGAQLVSLDITELSLIEQEIESKKQASSTNSINGFPAPTPKNVGKIKISMNVSGLNYENLKVLLKKIENNLRLLNVESVDFNNSDFSANINLTAYYTKE